MAATSAAIVLGFPLLQFVRRCPRPAGGNSAAASGLTPIVCLVLVQHPVKAGEPIDDRARFPRTGVAISALEAGLSR
jgi:hypothetical protein